VAYFRVTESVLVDKDRFPTDEVYGATDEPTLRLITCRGRVDREERRTRAISSCSPNIWATTRPTR
jgi:hypothetical protein